MIRVFASTALLLGSVAAGWADTHDTVPVADPNAIGERTLGTIAVDNEGSGMTTQSSVDLQANRSGAPVTPMNDQMMEGSTTNVPALDDGTVVDNPQTPATAVIQDGRVVTDTAGTGGDATLTTGGTSMATSSADVIVEPDIAAAPGSVVGPVVEREGYAIMQYDTIVLPQLEGVTIYGLDDEALGEIGYTVNAAASPTGEPLAILDVGGFLGLGEREVALPIGAMTVLTGQDGLRAYVDMDRDGLDALPEYVR